MRYKSIKISEDIDAVDFSDYGFDDYDLGDFQPEVAEEPAIDSGMELTTDIGMDAPVEVAPVTVGSPALSTVRSDIDNIIATLSDVPLGEFKELVGELERLTSVIREKGIRFVTESKK